MVPLSLHNYLNALSQVHARIFQKNIVVVTNEAKKKRENSILDTHGQQLDKDLLHLQI